MLKINKNESCRVGQSVNALARLVVGFWRRWHITQLFLYRWHVYALCFFYIYQNTRFKKIISLFVYNKPYVFVSVITEVYVSFVLMMAALSIVITILNLRLHLRADQSAVPKWLKFFTLKVLLRISCQSSRVEDYVVSNEVSNEGIAEYHFLNRMSTTCTRPQVPIRKDRVFPFHCKEVSALLDLFFFHLFNIIMFIMTMVLVIILSVSDGPPTKTTHSE